ncbi:MAG: Nramp family divalent metal transporter [Bryobacterales bacterium]|nr:Nramp family divalent metal transporter [Bryobacterales bacterium]
MSTSSLQDPYQLRPEDIETPPIRFAAIFRRIGPGLILASSIVGSGELIATTVLGAENGYTLLWLIIVSCLIKLAVQNELGRYAIGTGETTLEAFNRVPGPRLGVSWVVWLWVLMIAMTLMQVGGMMGGISEILHDLMPAISVAGWVWIVAAGTAVLLVAGRYSLVERVAMGLVVSFTVLTVSCAFLLIKRPEFFSWDALLGGLMFSMPQGGFVTAVAAFGITGVGATELVMYPYWCIEKGYARFTGKRDDTPAWRQRAFGWIKVMGVDVLNSMVIYTFATIAFYLLGAGILNGMGLMPQGSEMVKALSNMYTETLGHWSLYLFLVGAFAVFYSTLFASTAAHCRMVPDFLAMLGVFDKNNYALRLRYTRIFVVVLLFVPAVYFMFLKAPVLMVKIGGVAQALMLPVIGFVAVWLRYRHMPRQILPKGWLTLALWVSAVVMAVMTGYSVLMQFAG